MRYERVACPECGEMVARNWLLRHLKTEHPIEGQRGKDDAQFVVELEDGRRAVCWRATAQPYEDCTFSAGLVSGIEPDTMYSRLDRDGEELLTLFLRRDEMLAIAWSMLGALWSAEMIDQADGLWCPRCGEVFHDEEA